MGDMRKKLCAALLLALLLCLFAPIAQAAQCAPDRHNYVEVRRVPATPMEDGEVDFACTICGHEYTNILFATNHLWGPWETILAPTCTEPGRRRRTCTRAQPHNEYAAIPALGHDYRETRIEPSCFEPGRIIFVCANDATHTYEELIPAHGSHSFGDWRTETPAGEGTEGQEVRECGRCDFEEFRALDALPIATTAAPPTEPPTEPPRTLPVLDIILVSANVISLGYFAFLLIPYILGLAFARRRRKALILRDELRREADELHGYE